MLTRFHRLRRGNRGQALVLFALSVLVLALVTVSTINVGEVVYEKILLQNAADNLAYSTAVTEARAYNIVSYINRAMVLHYSTMMTFAAYLSHAQYLDWAIMPIVSVLAVILQFLGIPGCTIVKYMRMWYGVLDGHNPLFSPVNFCPPPNYSGHGAVELGMAYLTAANELLYLVQEAVLVWAGLFILDSQSFARLTDPRAEIPSIAPGSLASSLPPALQAATNPFVLENLRSIYSPAEHKRDDNYLGVPSRTKGLPVHPSYRGNKLEVDQYARFVMMEIANASRDVWTAGQKKGPLFFGRRWTFDLGKMLLGNNFACGTLLAGLVKIAGLVAAAFGAGPLALLTMFFGMRIEKTAETRLRGFESTLRSDQIFSAERLIVRDTVAHKKKSCLCCGVTKTLKCKRCVNWICIPPNVKMECDEISRIDLVVALDNRGSGAPAPNLFSPTPLGSSAEAGGHHQIWGKVTLKFFGLASLNIGPFSKVDHKKHYFKGVTPYVLSRPVLDYPQVYHFGQPCNFAALVKNLPGRVFKRKWTREGKTLDYTKHKDLYGQAGSLPVSGRGLWDRDMAAFAVGRAYYHRPGAWKEPPNFFNPLWQARLAPVREHWEFGVGLTGVGGGLCGPAGLLVLPLDWQAAVCGMGIGGGSAAEVVIH